MNRLMVTLTTGLLGLAVVAEDASASRASRDAQYECEDALERRYDAEGFHGVTVSYRGGDYKVTGYAEQDREDAWFECWVDNGRVEDLDFDGWSHRDDDDDDDKAKKVAAGVAAVAIIAAIASAKKSHDNDHDYEHGRYDDDDDRPVTWSPARNVNCYRNTRQCYETGKGYSAYWTNREFH